MKRLLISAFAAAMLASVPALAEPGDHHDRGKGRDNPQAGHVDTGHIDTGHVDTGHNDSGHGHIGRTPNVIFGTGHPDTSGDHKGGDHKGGDHPVDRGNVFQNQHNNDHGTGTFGVFHKPGKFNPVITPRSERPSNWNAQPRHFDRNTYRRSFEAPHRFHYRGYSRPRGWYARRWNYGDFLPRIFWAQDYWLTDWWMFDLPVPPYGYRWVRYGDDALLVNVYTGEVLEVEYDLFD